MEGQSPTTYHPELVDSARGGVPGGALGGMSGDHWLGVEPQTGRDLFARLVYGARVSLGVALAATLVEVALRVLVGIAAGLGNRWVDQALGRFTDVVMSLLDELRREPGLALVFIAHDLAVVRQVSDRLAVLRQGRVVEYGPADEVYESPRDPYARRLLASVPALGPALAALRRAERREPAAPR